LIVVTSLLNYLTMD